MKYFLIYCLLLPFLLNAQTNNKTFFLGHSLVNFHTPNMVKKLSDAAGISFPYNANIGNGASLYWHYTSPDTGQGDTWTTTLPQGGFDKFLLTEALPLDAYLEWNTHEYADSFFIYARAYNPDVKLYVYETWHCIYSGTGSGCTSWEWDPDTLIAFKDRIIQDLPKWESIADSINEKYGVCNAFVVPAGQALLVLSDSIDAGAVPGISSLSDLFVDNIHVSLRGAYFIACVMYSCLNKTSPEGLPNALTDPWNTPYSTYTTEANPVPTPTQAAIFQQIAWQTASNYAKSGINTNTLTLSGAANVCTNDTYTYTVSGGTAGIPYEWIISGGTITNGGGNNDTSCTVQWNNGGNGNIQVNQSTP
ncbi:MAG: hypothetical protein IPL35_00935 [Sphingobacteriales bacterium]|nr:hypothetical protein [Sphingobacteriales bacterium]